MTDIELLRQEFNTKIKKMQEDLVDKLLYLHSKKEALLAILQLTGSVHKRGKYFPNNYVASQEFIKQRQELADSIVAKLNIDEKEKGNKTDRDYELRVFDLKSECGRKIQKEYRSEYLLDYFQQVTGDNIHSFGFIVELNNEKQSFFGTTRTELDSFWYNLTSNTRSMILVAEKYLEHDIDLELVVNALLGHTDKVYSIALYNDLEIEKKKMENPDFSQLEQAVYRYIGKPNDKSRRTKR